VGSHISFDKVNNLWRGSVRKVLFPLVAGLGSGTVFQVGDTTLTCMMPANIYFQTPLVALQAAMPIKDMATSTATFAFLRYIPWLIFVLSMLTIIHIILER
jgi:hypothetical protein